MLLDEKEIIYFESDGRYVNVYSKNKTFKIINTLKEMSEQLKDRYFEFIHKSYLINLDNVVEKHTNEVTMINGDVLQIAKRREAEFKKIFNDYLDR